MYGSQKLHVKETHLVFTTDMFSRKTFGEYFTRLYYVILNPISSFDPFYVCRRTHYIEKKCFLVRDECISRSNDLMNRIRILCVSYLYAHQNTKCAKAHK